MKFLKDLWAKITRKKSPEIDGPPENVYDKLIPNYVRKLPMKSPAILKQFVDSNDELICDYILGCIRNAIRDNSPEAVLFRLGESTLIAKVLKEDFVYALQALDAIYLKAERYELVEECRTLILQLHVDRLIDDSKV